MLMTSGQWDLHALEALEREASEIFEVLDVPERLRSPPIKTQKIMDLELQDHIKHCSCSCNHMGYGNYMDYQQTSCFGGLPDVTEHTTTATTHHSSGVSSSVGGGGDGGGGGGGGGSIIRSLHKEQPYTSSTESLTNNLKATTNSSPSRNNTVANNNNNSNNRITEKDRKWCFFAVTFFIALTTCVVIISLVIEYFLEDTTDRNSQEHRMDVVKRILHETPLIDGHNDLAWNIKRYSHNRFEFLNFSEGLDKIEPWSHSPWSHTDIPRLKRGFVGAQFWSAYVPCEAQGLDAVQLALEQIDVIQRFTELYEKYTTLVSSSQDILTTHRSGLIASMIGVEGGHALGSSLGVLRSMHSLGVRYLTITHKCDTTWAGSAESSDKGLTPFGRAVIKEMNRIGMIIDLSHSSDATAREVLELTRAPVMFSHSAARTICNSTRNIADDILREVAENGGIVMVSFYSLHVTCSNYATLKDVIMHINYIRAVAGVQHIGIGAGYDGIDSTPIGLEDVSKYPDLFAELLEDPNWSESDISLLAGKNLLRVLKSVENVRDYWRNANIPPGENFEPPKKSPCAYMPS